MIARLRGINPLTALAAAVLLVCATYVMPAPTGPIVTLTIALVLAGMSGVGRRVTSVAAEKERSERKPRLSG